jgi:hypothetical protein
VIDTPSSRPDQAPADADTTPASAPTRGGGFTFTDPGCRTDVRLGALIVLGSVFLWLWWGPTNSSRLYLVGAILLLWGVPLQALQARSIGRPGFPWKLGLALAIAGGAMWPDLCYRETPSGALHWQEVAPLLVGAGVWILAWWPVARTGKRGAGHARSDGPQPVGAP